MDRLANIAKQCRARLCLAVIFSLALTFFLCSRPAAAAVPQHRHTESTELTHEQPATKDGAGDMQHAGHDTGMGQARQTEGHDMAGRGDKDDVVDHAETAEHVHPVASEENAGKVDLDEKLGSHIPLDLTFIDEQGNPVKLADLVSKPTIIAPVYYRCPNVCHFLQGDLARVLPGLKLKAGEDYQVISFSFDETEKPELAQRSRNTYYAAMKNQYPETAWHFLTGDLETIHELTDAAGYHFQRVGHEFLHPVAFFVVSPEGMIVRYLHGTHILPKDLTLALYEAKSGQVGTTIRKMVQYCFSFDPEQKTYVFNILRVSATAILTTLVIFAAYLVFGGKKSKKDKSL